MQQILFSFLVLKHSQCNCPVFFLDRFSNSGIQIICCFLDLRVALLFHLFQFLAGLVGSWSSNWILLYIRAVLDKMK